MVAVPRAHRLALAVCSILIAATLASLAAPPATPPVTPADSLRAIGEHLFVSGQYDSLLKVASTFARRAQTSGDSVLLGRAITQHGRALLMFGRAGAEREIDTGNRIAESLRDTTGLLPALSFKGFARWTAGKPGYPNAFTISCDASTSTSPRRRLPVRCVGLSGRLYARCHRAEQRSRGRQLLRLRGR